MCGGTLRRVLFAMTYQGLSPRVRGNRVDRGRRCVRQGSIPACAGEPSIHRSLAIDWRVYPRVCGGTCVDGITLSVHTGLSPRVRGNPAERTSARAFSRSIPACAGEPTVIALILNSTKVYPRVCGGTDESSVPQQRHRGLSPRVRGNRRRCIGYAGNHGSIPACAGEPIPNWPTASSWKVYPRVCGGTPPLSGLFTIAMGLSPRVRGNRVGLLLACSWCRVYPRVCGGTHHHDDWYDIGEGLSPRVRGNLTRSSAWALTCGSIPACAGEPLCLLYRL